jgi:hypothetical protein
MNVLITGNGKSGSYQIRAAQLGKAIGADVVPNALDVGAYDIVVLVKKARLDIADRARRAGVKVVVDIVDAWPQPEGNKWDRAACLAWLKGYVNSLKPDGIVAATHAMALDCEQFCIPTLYLPHHYRPGIERNPIREEVKVVGYEGAEHYLVRWRAVLEKECARRGWSFVVNPASLAQLDIVVALRDEDGYAPRHWKSGVKMSNAMGSGTPFIGCREAGYMEMAVGNTSKWADNETELKVAFDALTPQAERRRASEWMLAVAPSIEKVAAKYRAWLETVGA